MTQYGYQRNQGFPFRGGISNEIIDRFFLENGEKAFWWRAAYCSCSNGRQQMVNLADQQATPLDPGRATITCKVCNGTGYVFQAQGLVRIVTDTINYARQAEVMGLAEPGDLAVYTPPRGKASGVGDNDILRFLTPQPFSGSVLIRSADTFDVMPFCAASAKPIRCFSSNPTTGVVTDYVAGTDFMLVPNSRLITWATGHGPAANTQYAIKYDALYTYRASALPLVFFKRGFPLGTQLILKKRINSTPIFGVDSTPVNGGWGTVYWGVGPWGG